MWNVRVLAFVFLVVSLCGNCAKASEENAMERDDQDVAVLVGKDKVGLWGDMGVNPACGDANANTLQLGSAALRTRVESCVRSKAFAMVATAVQLLMRNIPVRFDQYNDRPRGCVQMELTVEKVASGAVTNSWLVIVDVDNKTETQNAHYGYTVEGIVPKVTKETGHIFFPPTVFPPNVRPWKQALGQKVSFTDQITEASTLYRLLGISYNQFYTRQPAPGDNYQDSTGTRVTGDQDSRASATTASRIPRDFA